VELGDIKGYRIRFQLATVPGQTAFNETRRVVLKGADGVVFVADSQWTMLPKNLEAWQNLKDNLKSNNVAFEGMPVVIQYNKRDLADILSVEAMQEALGLSSFPFVEAVASAGRGVTETFKLISKLTFVDLLRRLQGRRPEEASLPAAREAKDDLQSWKQSLFTRVDAKEPRRPRPLAAVPPSEEPPFETDEPPAAEAAPVDEGPLEPAPFVPRKAAAAPVPPPAEPVEPLEVVDEMEPETAEPLPAPALPAEMPSSPSARETVAQPAAAAPAGLAEMLRELEARLDARLEARLIEASDRLQQARTDFARVDAACNVLASRLEVAERQVSEAAAGRDDSLQAVESRLRSIEERARTDSQEIARITDVSERLEDQGSRIEAHDQNLVAASERLDAHEGKLEGSQKRNDFVEKRLHTLEDDVGMALVSLTERVEKLQQQIHAVVGSFEALQRTQEEKTNQGRREAEDIRSQLAPLLEAQGQRQAADERLLAEMDRLRESLADSLSDLSENLRRAVRGV